MPRKKGKKYIVHHDPLEIGGFRKGVGFSSEDMYWMLKFGNFTLGTVIKCPPYYHIGIVCVDEDWNNEQCLRTPMRNQKKKIL